MLVAIPTVAPAQAAELKALAAVIGVKFALKNSGEIRLFETLGGKKIVCSAVTGSGEFSSERAGSVEFKFTECISSGVKCTGLGDVTGGSITFVANIDIRHLLPNSEDVNIAILLGSTHFSCIGILFVASGCIASMDVLDKAGGESIVNKSLENAFVAFLQEKGDQKPTSIDTDNSLGMEECVPKLKEGTAESESSGQLMNLELEKSELGRVALLVDLTGTF